MITWLANIFNYSYLQPCFFFTSYSFCLASLSRSCLLFNLFPFLLQCVCNTTFMVLVRATPTHVKCAVRHAVKVIYRHACERTIEENYTYIHITRKMVPITRRASSFLVFFVCMLRGWSFQKQNGEEEGETEQKQQQTYHLPQGYNIFHRLQVHHLTLTRGVGSKYTLVRPMKLSNNSYIV